MALDKSAWIPYSPANPPAFNADLPRSTWDEFYRVALALGALDRPVSLSENCIDALTVDVAPAFTRIFDTPVTIVWESPPGQTDTATGIWTCPREGLYQLSYFGNVAPAGVPGDRVYTLEVRSTQTFINGDPDRVITLRDSGDDSEYLSVVGPQLLSCAQGDTVRIDARCTISGAPSPVVVNLTSSWQIHRISGVR